MSVANHGLADERRRYSRLRPCPENGKVLEAIAEGLMNLDWLGKTVRIQVTVRPEIEFVQSYLDRPLWDVEEVRAAIHERLTGLRREIDSDASVTGIRISLGGNAAEVNCCLLRDRRAAALRPADA